MEKELVLPTYEFELPSPDADAGLETKALTHPLRLLQLRFPDIPLRSRQIPGFRAGVIESAGREADVFHNHAGETDAVLYRPALIQYRVAGGCAALFGHGEGAHALERWWLSAPDALHFGKRSYALHTVELRRETFQMAMCESWKYYRVHDYLALNADNYRRWLDTPRLADKAILLESALVSHLLSFCQSAGWHLPERLEVQLMDIHRLHKTLYHGIDLMAFELSYRCNLLLPDGIALGKAVSHGFGVQWPVHQKEPVQENIIEMMTDEMHPI